MRARWIGRRSMGGRRAAKRERGGEEERRPAATKKGRKRGQNFALSIAPRAPMTRTTVPGSSSPGCRVARSTVTWRDWRRSRCCAGAAAAAAGAAAGVSSEEAAAATTDVWRGFSARRLRIGCGDRGGRWVRGSGRVVSGRADRQGRGSRARRRRAAGREERVVVLMGSRGRQKNKRATHAATLGTRRPAARCAGAMRDALLLMSILLIAADAFWLKKERGRRGGRRGGGETRRGRRGGGREVCCPSRPSLRARGSPTPLSSPYQSPKPNTRAD
jgi:hypothetical protein